ncbi:MAG: fibronectin type III domain-containing protein, partial [Bdellovibrionales bacterium]|nr:fibronectin type III domain-containing protein [Bdellovibrionales bacterium]
MFKTILFLTVVFCNVNVFAQSLLPYVYLTFENEDTSTSVTINFMTDKKSANSYAYYATESAEGEPDAYNYKIPSRVGEINNINRSYHHVQLRSLTPNSTYYFVVGDEKIGFSQEYKFRTLPNDHTPIKILTGGDMSTGDKVNKVPEYAMTKEPHVILIGGDIAYANGKTKELKRWDQWFDNMMKVMISPDGFLTPLIVAIGNHEVTTGIALPWGQAPFYEQIFAQENGKTFFTRNLG